MLSSKGKMYYDAAKDIIWFGDAMISQFRGNASSPSTKENFTRQMKVSLENKSLTLKANGSYSAMMEKAPESGTYTFDAVAKTITLKPGTSGGAIKTFMVTNQDELEQVQQGTANMLTILYHKK